jgi:hypothetical protein
VDSEKRLCFILIATRSTSHALILQWYYECYIDINLLLFASCFILCYDYVFLQISISGFLYASIIGCCFSRGVNRWPRVQSSRFLARWGGVETKDARFLVCCEGKPGCGAHSTIEALFVAGDGKNSDLRVSVHFLFLPFSPHIFLYPVSPFDRASEIKLVMKATSRLGLRMPGMLTR